MSLYEKLQQTIAQMGDMSPGEQLLAATLAGDDELAWLAEFLALPHWFTIPLVDRLMPGDWKPDPGGDFFGQPPDYIGRLLELPIVAELPAAAGFEEMRLFAIDEPYRGLLRRRWLDGDRRAELKEQSNRLYKYFSFQADKADEVARAVWEEEALFHRLVSNERDAFLDFQAYFEAAAARFEAGRCQALIELAQEQQPFQETRGEQARTVSNWLPYYQGRLKLMQGDGNYARQLFQQARTQAGPARELAGRAAAGLGDASLAMGEWAEAMKAYESSLRTWYRVPAGGTSIWRQIWSAVRDREWAIGGRLGRLLAAVSGPGAQAELRPAERLESVRVLTRMGDLALSMGRDPLTLGEVEWRVKQRASAKDDEAFERALRLHETSRAERRVLSTVIQERLRQLAARFYRLAEQLLMVAERQAGIDTGDRPARQGYLARAWWGLRRQVRLGQATIDLHRGRVDQARSQLLDLGVDGDDRRQQAELDILLGDCDLSQGRLEQAAARYVAAVERLHDAWDRPLYARAMHALGRAQVVQGEWSVGVEQIEQSRAIFAELDEPREEMHVQNTLRELVADREGPEEVRATLLRRMEDWPAHHFSYPSSRPVLQQVMTIWYAVLPVWGLVLGAVVFSLSSLIGRWLLDLVGRPEIYDLGWVWLVQGIFSLVIGIMSADSSRTFRRAIGWLIRPDWLWARQPALITVDDQRFIQWDYYGSARTIYWFEVSQLRSGQSEYWVVGESSLTYRGGKGGRTILIALDKALAFDSQVIGYLMLDRLVKERVREAVQDNRSYSSTFRKLTTQWAVLVAFMVALLGCPVTLALTSTNTAWWAVAFKVLAWVVVGFFGLGFGTLIVRQVRDAIRMRRFLYPRDLPDLPPPDRFVSRTKYGYKEDQALL